MDIRALEEFLAIIEHGSILGAAEALSLPQPGLSRRLRTLEHSLGVQLVARSSQGVSTTVYGELLERHARLVLHDRQQALDELQALRDGVVGHGRVGVAPALSSILPGAIARLTEDRPGLTFSVTDGTYDTLVRDLRNGEIDGAFTLLVPSEEHEGLAVRKLVDDPVRLFCNAKHPLRKKKSVPFSALVEERWVLINRPRSIPEMFRRAAASQGFDSPRLCVETDSLDLVKSLVMTSSFLAALPAGAMAAELKEGRVSTLAVADLPTLTTGFLHRQEVLPPAVSLLLAEVEASS